MSGPGGRLLPPGHVPEPATQSLVNRTLLYIEDDENNIRLVEMLLERRPQIELHIAWTGRDGVQAAIDKRPGLILLDNRLPDTTGAEILRELASAAATAAIPVVVLSSDSDEVIDELMASGASAFITKPFDIHQFLATIDRYLP
jgi:CheY-like chemotaxis protein